MQFNDLLALQNIDPAKVLIMRHRPFERGLWKHFYRIAIKEPELYNAYQSSHAEREERQLARAEYLASFIGNEPGKAVFIGLYKNLGHRPITLEEYWAFPERQALKALGMQGFTGDRPTELHFHLELSDFYADWKGRLIVKWPGGERSWSRWAKDNELKVDAIREVEDVAPPMDAWDDMSLTWPELKSLWPDWQAKLSGWRGVYFILDKSDGRGYVGSAYGESNLLGRWLNYADTGHGGNKNLRSRSPENFVFSILELVSPTLDAEKVVEIENRWKKRLSTISHGLNEN